MTYRRDIDGLRAIAVLAVILFHFKLVGFDGGYVGVDIFFVISGYLIGGLIVDETAAGTFTYARFYSRRIKRLFAAFFVLALATVPFAWWLLLPVEFWAQAKSIVASTVFVPNMLFYRDVGYFGAGAITKPLLHTWSLAVEEQFYIFFPLVMRLAVRAGTRWIPIVLVVVSIVSLAYSQYLMTIDPAAAFYWLPSRAWELTLGAIAAVPRFREVHIAAPLRRVLTPLAVVAVLAPTMLYSETTPFPGWTAVPPCIGTAWLLWVGRLGENGLTQRALSSTVPVAIGRISYSLYLWHWPVFVFLMAYTGGEAGWLLRFAAISLVFVLAALSWRFVEQPIRYSKRSPPVVFGGALLASILLALVGFGIWYAKGVPGRLSDETRVIADAAGDFAQTGGKCVGENNAEWPGLEHCRIGVLDAPPTFLIWGDSHVRAIRDGADQVAKENALSGAMVHAGGCPPLFDIVKTEPASGPRADRECAIQNKALRKILETPGTIKKILIVGRWAYYTEGRGTGIDRHNAIEVRSASGTSTSQARVVADALRDTVAWLHSRGYQVYLLEPIPEIPEFTGGRLFQALRSGREDLKTAIARFGTVPQQQVDDRQRRSIEALRAAAADGRATILPTHQLFCASDICSAWSGSSQAYFDNNHVTVTTSRRIRQTFLPAMTP